MSLESQFFPFRGEMCFMLRKGAISEGFRRRESNPMRNFLVVLMAIALSWGMAESATAYIYLSTTTEATLGGLTFQPEDVARYDPGTNTASLFFDGSAFSMNEDLDAVSVLDNGDIIVLATEAGATLGGLTFGADDLVRYNPITDTATLYFDGSSFFGNGDIDAASVLSNGNLVFSTGETVNLGGSDYTKGDLILYDFDAGTFSLFFDEDLFVGLADIDAVSVLANGNIVLSTVTTETLGGLEFRDGDLAEYNPGSDTATLYFDRDNFEGKFGEDIDAVSVGSVVPIPGAAWLLFSGLMGLAGWKKKIRK